MANFIRQRDVQYIDNPDGTFNRVDTYAVIECDRCGAHVELVDFFCTECPKCGAEYNGGGQRLAPHSQWGEETGETYADIITGVYNPDPEWADDYFEQDYDL
jgi:PHP family Zn ribbon phosphoesterase